MWCIVELAERLFYHSERGLTVVMLSCLRLLEKRLRRCKEVVRSQNQVLPGQSKRSVLVADQFQAAGTVSAASSDDDELAVLHIDSKGRYHANELPAQDLEIEDPQLVVSIEAREAAHPFALKGSDHLHLLSAASMECMFEVQRPISPRTPEPSFSDSSSSSCCYCHAEQVCAKTAHCGERCDIHQQQHHQQCTLSQQHSCCVQNQKQHAALFAAREASYLSSIAKLQCQVTRMTQLQQLLAADYADLESVLKQSERQRRDYAARYAFVVLDTDSDGYISTAQVGL
jgi:hypothetical protein